MFGESDVLLAKFSSLWICLSRRLSLGCVKRSRKKKHLLSIFSELQTSWTFPCWQLTPFCSGLVGCLLAGFKNTAKIVINKSIFFLWKIWQFWSRNNYLGLGSILLLNPNHFKYQLLPQNKQEIRIQSDSKNPTLIQGCWRLSWIVILFLWAENVFRFRLMRNWNLGLFRY